MSKYDELKRYLEVMTGPALVDSAEILDLIAENERLSSENKQRELCEAKLIAGGDSLNREADNLLARLLAVIAERNQLKAEVEALRERAAYWTQRAKSAEGHLHANDMQQAARELHKRTAHAATPWDELTVSQRAQIEGAVVTVIAAVNAQRDARHPVDCNMESSK